MAVCFIFQYTSLYAPFLLWHSEVKGKKKKDYLRIENKGKQQSHFRTLKE